MDFVKDKIRPLYFRYLGAAFGSALITSIYSIVDMAMVGQYQGPDGTAALAVVAPVWNIIYISTVCLYAEIIMDVEHTIFNI